MRKCPRCGDFKDESDWPGGVRPSYCTPCKRQYDREYWSRTKDLRNARKQENAKGIRRRNRKFMMDYLSEHPCVDCGESDPVVLEFDHLYDKSANVSDMQVVSLSRLAAEIAKCEVRCANCHRRKTAHELNYYDGL